MSRYTDIANAGELSQQAGGAARLEFWRYADDIQRLWKAAKPAYKVAYGWYDEPAHFKCVACGGRSPLFSSWGDDYDEEAGYPKDITIEDVDHKPDCPHEALRPLFGE